MKDSRAPLPSAAPGGGSNTYTYTGTEAGANERGAFQWPRKESEAVAITPQQFRWLMEGLQIEQPKALRPVGRVAVI